MIRNSLALLTACAVAFSPAFAATQGKATPKPAAKKPVPAKAPAKAPAKKPAVAEPFAVPFDDGPPSINGEACIVLDARTGRVLHEKNADHERPVASTQKLLTALIIAEEGGLDKIVTVQASDTWAEPSKLYIKPGEKYTRQKLLQILMVKSMNDVARALARDNAGSVEKFAAKMNARARALGMNQSHFVNPNGLPAPGQYSTARDMAKVAVVAYRNPTIRSMVSIKTLTWRYPDGRVTQFNNTNLVLRNYALCNGMKTGYTQASGFCLISSASYGGRDVIVVILGNSRQIWNDSYRLLNWGLSA
jgi:D-alanyl-D-alanine carboxypeptidase (penicillin-binding protein 5/6)